MSTMGDVWIKRLYNNGAATVDTVETNFRQLAKSINTFMRNNNSTVDAAFEAKTIYATGSANKTETGLNEQARGDCGAPGKKSEMIQCAEGIKVALNPTEHGWQLTRG
ncbi:unnamed protein product [Alternaria alternata]